MLNHALTFAIAIGYFRLLQLSPDRKYVSELLREAQLEKTTNRKELFTVCITIRWN